MKTEKLTKQGVRDLNGPTQNTRRITNHETCFHDFRHMVGCTGCWARDFGGCSDNETFCEEVCQRCGLHRTI